ncbi:hypothetical protein KSP35_11110 [Aquihabitans sp. G128]|uniref:SLC13 family permease n=1 Tax=Aquihabitans sp. G128 TaxID=2849779 RepID=UPI001C20FB64|nr:SLC13 family permease [Aquihabitans sp. G128]QXC63281.1 hypothetical protein KSP35_11110 [Aquihabitans sp. G128]
MPSFALLASLGVLAAVLVAVVRAPGGRREVVWAAPAAALVLATGLVGRHEAWEALDRLAPTLLFLAAMFVISKVADAAGLFAVASGAIGRAGRRGPGALLATVAVGAVVVTTVLSLDATAVLFTPVVVAAVRGRRDRDRSLLATVFLANGASLLLPVANLTNLLAFEQLGLTFPAFASRMALPTVAAAVVITLGARFLAPAAEAPAARALGDGPDAGGAGADPSEAPATDEAWWAGAGLVVLLVAFVTASLVGIEPALVAAAGAVVLGAVAWRRHVVAPAVLARAVDPAFLAFVAALGIVVAAPAEQGLTRFVADRLPDGHGLAALLAVAFGAALLANLVTNLPATLVLLPALAGRGPGLLLAALIGVNIGPNLTITGSLATLLWRRIVRAEGVEPPLRSFVRTTVLTTPLAIAAATTALWATGRFP